MTDTQIYIHIYIRNAKCHSAHLLVSLRSAIKSHKLMAILWAHAGTSYSVKFQLHDLHSLADLTNISFVNTKHVTVYMTSYRTSSYQVVAYSRVYYSL